MYCGDLISAGADQARADDLIDDVMALHMAAAFLKSRMLLKADRTKEENALIVSWSEKIRDTEFDIWAS